MLRVFSGVTELPMDDGVLRLEEAREYRLELGTGTEGVSFDGVPLARDREGAFSLVTGHWVARSRLEIAHREGKVQRVVVEVTPRREKLGTREWELMLDDLEAWLPSVTAGTNGGEHGAAGRIGACAPIVAQALSPLLPALVRALRRVIARPRHGTRERWGEQRVRQLRRIDRTTMTWASRNPEASRTLSGWSPRVDAQALVPYVEAPETRDCPANRHVAWLVARVCAAVDSAAAHLAAVAADAEPDVRKSLEARRALLEQGRAALADVRDRSFLARLPASPSPSAAFALADDPAYARLHRLARPFLSPCFRPDVVDDQTPASVRPSYGIYELWTFMALGRLLEAHRPDLAWRARKLDLLLRGAGSGAEFTGKGPAGTLRLIFNPRFAGYRRRNGKERWSLSRARRPDIVLAWEPREDAHRWLCIDAKYRVTPSNVEKALASAHIYRDSLLWPALGGRCIAALLAVPSRHTQCAAWFEWALVQEHGIGVFELRPGLHMHGMADRLMRLVGVE